jgi:uncharacterized protein YodC (DUF2158 family)
MSQFRPGDQVRLRSGGPPMTVLSVSAKGSDVKCSWFDASQAFHQEHFPPGALVLLESAEQPRGEGSMGQILAKSMEKQHEVAKQQRRSPRR